MATPHIFWNLWKERNNCIFREKISSPTMVYEKANHGFSENWNSRLLRIENNSKHFSKSTDRASCCWEAPPNGWIKINFDGAAKGNAGPSGCGSVLRDNYGNFIAAIALPLGSQNNHMAEVAGALYGIQLASDLNFKKIWVEGDSLNIINSLKGKNPPSWTIENFIFKAQALISNCTKKFISHMYREGNTVADSLANVGIRLDDIMRWSYEDDLIEDTKSKINYDKIHHKQGRINDS